MATAIRHRRGGTTGASSVRRERPAAGAVAVSGAAQRRQNLAPIGFAVPQTLQGGPFCAVSATGAMDRVRWGTGLAGATAPGCSTTGTGSAGAAGAGSGDSGWIQPR